MRKPILILGGFALAASLFVVGISTKLYLHHLAVKKGVGPQHIFQLPEKPHCLTQELALAKAREAGGNRRRRGRFHALPLAAGALVRSYSASILAAR